MQELTEERLFERLIWIPAVGFEILWAGQGMLYERLLERAISTGENGCSRSKTVMRECKKRRGVGRGEKGK